MTRVWAVKLFSNPSAGPVASSFAMKKSQKSVIDRSIKDYVESPAIAYSYDSHYEDTPLLEYDCRFLAQVLPGEGRLLDVGCGTGRHLLEMASRGLECTGMDLSEHMLTLSAAKVEREGLKAALVKADMREPLPFADSSFDNVICMFSTLGLVPGSAARASFLGEVNRILADGGTLVLHVHNRLHNLWSPWGRHWLAKTYIWNRLFTDLEVGDRIMEYYRGIEDMYLHVFSLRETKALLARAGFRVTRLGYLNDSRSGEIAGPLASLRANGFLVAAAKM